MEHIVHIDDDLFIRDLVASRLSSDKYKVTSAANAKEAPASDSAAAKPG